MNWTLGALLPAGWFYAGHSWSHALRPRVRPVVVPVAIAVERVPAHLMIIDALVRSAASRAKLVGPGFVIQNATTVTVDGVIVATVICCDTSQIAPAPQQDARR